LARGTCGTRATRDTFLTMRKFSFLIVLLLLIIGSIAAWWINGITPADPSNNNTQSFEVTQGEGVREIANALKSQGLIKDPVIFFLLIKQKGVGEKIQAGEFQLSPSMSAGKIADELQLATDDVRITIPEGKRAEEIAVIFKNNFQNYQPSWEQQLDAQNGYLFPDTYSFHKESDINTIIATMENNFTKKYATIATGQSTKLTKAQIVTIASIVEREAKFSQDRPLVASVIINRLNAGMPLQVDATVQYAIGNSGNWWPTLTDSGNNIAPSSPYNSYTNSGLPPTPISNPGVEALKAVINAPQTNYFYYVSDKTGVNHYETSGEEHEADIQKYGL
jgi:peptidoglycan lytic transglycosylase G